MKKQHKWLLLFLLLAAQTATRAQPGGWGVNAGQFQYSMTVVAQIRINGVPNHLLNNYLVVLCEGQIRGYVTPVKFNGQAYYFLNLYSNIYKDEALYFRAFVGTNQKVYESAVPLLFKHHKAVGKASEPYQVDLTLADRPLIYSLSEVNYVENTCPDVLDVQASDNTNSEGNGLIYSIIGGADQARFSIHAQTGVLSWLNFVPDFDAPADVGGDNGYEVRVRVKDAANLTDEQLITVRVVKFAPPPTLTCPANLTIRTSDNGTGNCTATAFGTGAPLGTLCESRQVSYQLTDATLGSGTGQVPVNQIFEKGVTTVTYTRSGTGASQCSFTVTLRDDELPFLTCPGNIAKNTDPGQCTALVVYGVSSSDNCPGSVLTQLSGWANANLYPKGTTLVQWRVTDAAGLSANCTFLIAVTDAQAPALSCPANISRNTDLNQCTAVVSYTTPVFSDNCGGSSMIRISGPASGSAFSKGVTSVSWRATDAAGLSQNCTFTVTVTDNQVPTITCPANIAKNTDANLCTAVAAYTTPIFTDNCVGVSAALVSGGPSGTAFAKGINPVVWRVTDGAGLTKTCTFTVTVTDGQAPAITCPANLARNTGTGLCTAVTVYTTPTAMDNCSGVTVSLVSGGASGSVFAKGQTTVTWRAVDGAGLTKTCTFRVTVNDVQAPTVTCPANQVKNTDASVCTAVATYANATFTDNCTGGSVVKLSGLNSGTAFPKGVNNVTFRATDASGNIALCTMTVTVNDVQLPTITCPPNVSVTAAAGQCSAVATYANPVASDNCGILSNYLLSGLASGSVFPQGVTTNVWKATDNGGLTKTCALTVTVACGTGSEEVAGRSEELGGSSLKFEVRSLRLEVYPNPATTEVWIAVEGLDENGGMLSVYDPMGRMVWQSALASLATDDRQQATINVADFPTGLYRVRLQTENGCAAKTLVVNKL